MIDTLFEYIVIAEGILLATITGLFCVWVHRQKKNNKKSDERAELRKRESMFAEQAEMSSTLEEYFNRFGPLEPPKSENEIMLEEQARIMQQQAQEQAEINQALLGAINSLKAEISELKANKSASVIQPVEKQGSGIIILGESA